MFLNLDIPIASILVQFTLLHFVPMFVSLPICLSFVILSMHACGCLKGLILTMNCLSSKISGLDGFLKTSYDIYKEKDLVT